MRDEEAGLFSVLLFYEAELPLQACHSLPTPTPAWKVHQTISLASPSCILLFWAENVREMCCSHPKHLVKKRKKNFFKNLGA